MKAMHTCTSKTHLEQCASHTSLSTIDCPRPTKNPLWVPSYVSSAGLQARNNYYSSDCLAVLLVFCSATGGSTVCLPWHVWVHKPL